MSTTVATSEVLNRAADLIEERGWSQGTGWCLNGDQGGPLCLEGSIRVAAALDILVARPVLNVVRDYLTDTRPLDINAFAGYVIPFSWNDAYDRTAAEVVEVLRAAAVIEAAREQKMAEVSA
jgi:hypothetical protein